MQVIVGETRSRRNIATLQEHGWGRMFVVQPPTPFPFEKWCFDNKAFPPWQEAGCPIGLSIEDWDILWDSEDFERRLKLAEAIDSDPYMAEVDLFETMSQHSGLSPADCRQSLKDALADLPARDGAAKEAQFIQDVETIRAANQRMKAAQPKSKFSWKVLGMLLLAFVLAMICAYLGLNGGEW